MLDRGLLGRGEDRLDALADVEDDRPRLDPVHLAGDHLALAAGELVEDHVALGLAQALQDDLLGRLGVDAPEVARIELLDLDEIAHVGIGLVGLRLIERELGERILDLLDHRAGAVGADLAGVGVDLDVDVLDPVRPAPGGLDRLFDGPDQLLFGDLLLGVELQEGADEIATHACASRLHRSYRAAHKETWGSPTSGGGHSS